MGKYAIRDKKKTTFREPKALYWWRCSICKKMYLYFHEASICCANKKEIKGGM